MMPKVNWFSETCLSDLREGKKVFLVNAVPAQMTEVAPEGKSVKLVLVEVNSFDILANTGRPMLDMPVLVLRGANGDEVIYTGDYNVPRNDYNLNRLFLTAQAAWRYVRRMKATDLDEREKAILDNWAARQEIFFH